MRKGKAHTFNTVLEQMNQTRQLDVVQRSAAFLIQELLDFLQIGGRRCLRVVTSGRRAVIAVSRLTRRRL